MIVLIPAYEPGPALADLVRSLAHHIVVVVDDGSGPEYAEVFSLVRRLGADVLTSERNRGKGHALKTGFAYAAEKYPGIDVVCADSDGQHRPEDVEAVARHLTNSGAAMVLGGRRFTGDVPARSRLGNTVTRIAFRRLTGLALMDTQTGLRAYPAWMLPWLSQVAGDRFEYEQRLLLRAARERLPIAQVEITTVYLRRNESSHFRPVRDSLRVYRPLLAFAGSSLLAFVVDAAALFVLTSLTGDLVLSALTARLISATVNYRVNRRHVFGAGRGRFAPRYAALAVALLTANVVLLDALRSATGSLVAAKLLTEAALFAVSFLIQQRMIFTGDPAPAEPPARVIGRVRTGPPPPQRKHHRSTTGRAVEPGGARRRRTGNLPSAQSRNVLAPTRRPPVHDRFARAFSKAATRTLTDAETSVARPATDRQPDNCPRAPKTGTAIAPIPVVTSWSECT